MTSASIRCLACWIEAGAFLGPLAELEGPRLRQRGQRARRGRHELPEWHPAEMAAQAGRLPEWHPNGTLPERMPNRTEPYPNGPRTELCQKGRRSLPDWRFAPGAPGSRRTRPGVAGPKVAGRSSSQFRPKWQELAAALAGGIYTLLQSSGVPNGAHFPIDCACHRLSRWPSGSAPDGSFDLCPE